jgi:hypothetical protein
MVGSNSMVIANIHCPIVNERKVRYWQHLLYINGDFRIVRGQATKLWLDTFTCWKVLVKMMNHTTT